MKKRQILNLTLLALFVAMVILEVFAVIGVVRLNMLPTGLLILVIAVFLLIAVGIGFLLFYKSKRLRGKKARAAVRTRRIVAGLAIILMLIISIVICIVTGDVLKTIEAVSQDEPAAITRSVYVRADDNAKELTDASNYTFGYVKNYDTECTQQAVAEIQKVFGETPATASYDSVFKMVDALLNGQIDAIIMNSGYVSVLEYEEAYADFSEKTRVLAAVEIAGQTTQEPDEPEDPTDPEDPDAVTDPNATEPQATDPVVTEPQAADKMSPFVIYLSGSDTRSAMLNGGRSDVNILAVVNPNTRQVLLINSPRDFYVANPAGNNEMDKLTHCGIYGVGNSMKALGNLYGEKVNYYLQINFEGFKKAIDAMGGITVHSDYAFTAIRRTKIVAGDNYLTGQQALDFARERYTLAGGDNARGKNQMKVIKAVIEKATSGTTIINNYSAIISSLDGMFVMNVPMDLISELVKRQLSDMSGWDVFSYAAVGSGTMAETYSAPGLKLSCIKPSSSSVAKAKGLIDKVMAGVEITEEMVNG